ncbi:hypothetical protein ATK30_4897 [Amycolatopsis echigonensis]|uniref:Uncharacterized protein n=2 Tax=Pseudonocardiaceae TaxID=2070 RepID=A0A2N3WJI7_9PSEU|nr:MULTISPECIES: hypothetical protein [Pseudonocardiaceae]AEA23514.1 hypothetical protein Psed_1270 [Pseudonocardia dioxanivorans CB1190]PKV94028.1 hypothetical protein ATK30_4897 [Amycolatopsis niigatensis]
MRDRELHAQAGVWCHREPCVAVLVMEGEAADRSNGGAIAADALYRVALAHGLRLTTDLDHLALQPLVGWRMLIDGNRRVTLRWPRFQPLLDQAPLGLPTGWVRLALARQVVLVFAGYGLGLHEQARTAAPGLDRRLRCAAEVGALAAGAVTVSVLES